jgi:hypothetical protein
MPNSSQHQTTKDRSPSIDGIIDEFIDILADGDCKSESTALRSSVLKDQFEGVYGERLFTLSERSGDSGYTVNFTDISIENASNAAAILVAKFAPSSRYSNTSTPIISGEELGLIINDLGERNPAYYPQTLRVLNGDEILLFHQSKRDQVCYHPIVKRLQASHFFKVVSTGIDIAFQISSQFPNTLHLGETLDTLLNNSLHLLLSHYSMRGDGSEGFRSADHSHDVTKIVADEYGRLREYSETLLSRGNSIPNVLETGDDDRSPSIATDDIGGGQFDSEDANAVDLEVMKPRAALEAASIANNESAIQDAIDWIVEHQREQVLDSIAETSTSALSKPAKELLLRGDDGLVTQEWRMFQTTAANRIRKPLDEPALVDRAIVEDIFPSARLLFPDRITSPADVDADTLTALFREKAEDRIANAEPLSEVLLTAIKDLSQAWRKHFSHVLYEGEGVTVAKAGRKGLKYRIPGANQPAVGTSRFWPRIEFPSH